MRCHRTPWQQEAQRFPETISGLAALNVGKTDVKICLLFENFFYVANLTLHFAFDFFRGAPVA